MKRERILQTVISVILNKEQIGEQCDSAFAAVHNCISTAAAEPSESAKKEKLICILQSFWRGKSKYIDGCKREQLQKIASLAFGIRSVQSSRLREEVRQYTFQEIYMYYCYAERMAKGDDYLTLYFQKRAEERQKLLAAKKEKAEQQKRKALEEEQRKKDEMCGIDRWKYDIFEKQQDMNYFRNLDDEEKFQAEDRIAVARLLMEYWKEIGKWTGGKVSKKQAEKIAKIQEILEPHSSSLCKAP